MRKIIHQAIEVNAAFKKDLDISDKEKDILTDIRILTGFAAEKNIWRSKYWGRNLGASHWLGDLAGKQVVLKIQGAKPEVSEAEIVGLFERDNRSKLLRPPKLVKVIPWTKSKGYEALFMEHVSGEKVLEDKKIQTRKSIRKFLECYKEYRRNCIPKKAWFAEPEKADWRKESFDRLTSSSLKAFPDHPFRLKTDFQLAAQAFDLLEEVYKGVGPEFLHGHFSCNDLKYQDKYGKKVVLFSNLFWKWKYPFYDAVFAYHWFIYELNHVENITSRVVEDQRNIWHEELMKATEADRSENLNRLLNAALLERAAAGLIIDSFLVDPKRPIAKYLTDSTRDEVRKYIYLLSK